MPAFGRITFWFADPKPSEALFQCDGWRRNWLAFPNHQDADDDHPDSVLTSSLLFMALHLTKSWALLGMVPIVFGAGVLLSLIAWSAQSLIPGMIGHFVMDFGLFAYWWTGIAGNFPQRQISQTGVDQSFVITICMFVTSLLIVLIAILKLRQNRQFLNKGVPQGGT